jgi:hypothetical protein
MTVREAMEIVFKEVGESDETVKARMMMADTAVDSGSSSKAEIKPGLEREFIDGMKRFHEFFKTKRGQVVLKEAVSISQEALRKRSVKN